MPLGRVLYSRSRRTRNWSVSKSWWIWSRFHGTGCRSPGPDSSGTSRASSVSCRLRSTEPRCSRSLSPALPLTSSTRSTSWLSEPNSATHRAAVFSPTPGMFGRLSLGSPRSAAKSGYWAGVRPYLATTSSGVNRVMSLMPRRVISTVTWSLTSCRLSRSPLTMSTSMPASVAATVSVAMMSSAS